jgi:hypothetical protein
VSSVEALLESLQSLGLSAEVLPPKYLIYEF